ncbi:MAG: O-antigen ligase family protein [Proteobacteria bacterium]|nr:O-antigen ligase family protein [Pseudomonadota bacterium]NOG60213.1 O-antigen ligase family protein [Pseudomonadota bacterium]
MISNDLKRAARPSFLFFPVFFFALLTSVLASYFNYWIGISFLLLILSFGLSERFSYSYLSIAVIAFSVILIGNLFFIDSAYTAEDFYYIGFFVISFAVFSQLAISQITYAYKLLVYLFLLLAIWAFVQYYSGYYYLINSGLRSNTIFATPNSFAAAINLILFPLIAFNLKNKNNFPGYLAMLILFYALLTTQSRGGFLSFLVGYCSMYIILFKRREKIKQNNIKVLFGLTSMVLIFLTSHILDWQGNRKEKEFNLFEISRLQDISEHANVRLVLYDVAWQRIKEKPFLGHGYNNFQFYWLKDQKPPFYNSHTNFVHNDYLQLWFEIGVLGFLGITSIIVTFYYRIWRYFKNIKLRNMSIALALVGGLSAYFAHAVVDFVMYPCFLVLMFGAYLGTATRVLSETDKNICLVTNFIKKISELEWNNHFWRIFISIFLIINFSQPYIAELTFDYAKKNMEKGNVEIALKYYELTRRFAPYNADYYAIEGEYLRFALEHSEQGSREIAHRADELFVNGISSNPFDIRNILSRAILHRDYAKILSEPVNNDIILKWFEQVLFWRPSLFLAQTEYIKTLIIFGQTTKAKENLNKYMKINPDVDEFVNLKKELGF